MIKKGLIGYIIIYEDKSKNLKYLSYFMSLCAESNEKNNKNLA